MASKHQEQLWKKRYPERLQARRYWDTIHWNAVSFLTLHDGRQSRLFYDRISTNFFEDLMFFLRGLLGGIIRFLQGYASSFMKRAPRRKPQQTPYLLVITMGTVKYASEEDETLKACRKKGLETLTVHIAHGTSIVSDGKSLPMVSFLTPRDHIFAHFSWLKHVLLSGYHMFLSHDKKQRALYASVISDMRQYCIYVSFARRIIAEYGLPSLLFSLCPWSAASVAVSDHMKKRNVMTAGIRTQMTSEELELVVVNTDILFCKSLNEKRIFKSMFGVSGPRLKEGCLLSLPSFQQLEPMTLPAEYVLLLGTAPAMGQECHINYQYSKKLFRLAEMTGLPIIFKSHTLAAHLDQAWIAQNGIAKGKFVHILDPAYNREMIDHATLVVTAASTLIYYAILVCKPLILLESPYDGTHVNEFHKSPLFKINWNQEITADSLNWSKLQESALKAKSWFTQNYFLDKGPDYMIESLFGNSSLK